MERQVKELNDDEVVEISLRIKKKLEDKFGRRRVNTWLHEDIEVAEQFLRITWFEIRTELEK